MLGPTLVASALAAAVVSWGVPASVSAPLPSSRPALFGPDTALAPDAKVEGDTTQEIVRRIIRRHINEVKYCYEQELLRQPHLVGKIDVQFTVAASGQVSAAAVQRSTIGNERVESCTVAAVRRWQFPPPLDGRTVIITYPFVLTPTHAITIVAGTNGAGVVEIEPISSTLPTLQTVFVHT
jgi:TonB family protein